MGTLAQQRLRIDERSNNSVVYTPVTTYFDGSAMTDAKADGFVYRMSEAVPDGEEDPVKTYWKLVYDNSIHVSRFGVVSHPTLNQTASFQTAIDVCAKYGLTLDVSNFTIRGKAIELRCDMYSNRKGVLKFITDPTASGYSQGGFITVVRSGITVRGVNIDGDLIGYNPSNIVYASNKSDLTGVKGCTPFSITTYIEDIGDRTPSDTVVSGQPNPICSNVKIYDCKITNSYGTGFLIHGYNHLIDNVEVNRSVNAFGDCFGIFNFYKIRLTNCRAYDFMRMGFCSDYGGWQGGRNIQIIDSVAEYGHDCSAEYGGSNFNSGFWAEGTSETVWQNCWAIDCNINGFNFNLGSPSEYQFNSQTKCSVRIINCFVDYKGRIGNFQGHAITIATSTTFITGKSNPVDALVSGCTVEGAPSGLGIYIRNPDDRVVVTDCYVNWKSVPYVGDGDSYKSGILIFGPASIEGRMGKVLLQNIEMRYFGMDATQRAALINQDSGFGADISIVRFNEGGESDNYIKKVDLTIDNVRLLNSLQSLWIRSQYGSKDHDKIKIKNCGDVLYRGHADTVYVENDIRAKFTYVASFNYIKNLTLLNVDFCRYNPDIQVDYYVIRTVNFTIRDSSLIHNFWILSDGDNTLQRNKIYGYIVWQKVSDTTITNTDTYDSNISLYTGDAGIQYQIGANTTIIARVMDNLFSGNIIFETNDVPRFTMIGGNNYIPFEHAIVLRKGSTDHQYTALFTTAEGKLLRQYGASSEKPSVAPIGQKFRDDTLKKTLTMWSGNEWRDAAGTIV